MEQLEAAYQYQEFTVQNLDQLHVLVSSAHKTTHRNITYAVLNVILKCKNINFYNTKLGLIQGWRVSQIQENKYSFLMDR